MRRSTWMGLGLSAVLGLGPVAQSAGGEGGARAQAILEILSLDPGDYSLGLSWPWGGMAANHVMFNDHRGPFQAVVESSGQGVRVTFIGWGETPFVASADKMRIIYRVAGQRVIDFATEAIPGGAVRVRAVDRPLTQGRRLVIGLGDRAAKGVATVSVEARRE